MAGRPRHDPVAKAADGRSTYDRISGKDPKRHYVLTNPNDEECGTAYYVNELGYEVEHVRAGGPKSSSAFQGSEGAKVTSGGMVLVSCPMSRFEERVNDGQEHAGILERRILKDGGDTDPFRGRGFEIAINSGRRFTGEEA